LFARTVSRRAPYFGTIKPKFLDLEPKLCRVSMKKRRAVENHIGTVHALAMGNLCELAAGLCTEVTIPIGMRWIPRGMTIEYLAKAETDVMATARLDKTEWTGPENVGVPVTVTDAAGKEVVRAVISMYVSPPWCFTWPPGLTQPARRSWRCGKSLLSVLKPADLG
jgi:acyl-coenzyme A thioesterase PaaI-like protein